MLWVLALLGGLVAAATVLAPRFAKVQARQKSDSEDGLLIKIVAALEQHTRRTQTISGIYTWYQDAATQLGMDSTSVLQVFPELGPSSSSRRAYLIDPRFTPSTGLPILPFVQSVGGLDPLLGQVPGLESRILVASSSLRSLSLPVSSGVISAALFDSLWDWSPDGSGASPLSAVSAAWQGRGEHLHVARLDFRALFHQITLRHLGYSISGGGMTLVTNPVQRWFLKGTPLDLSHLGETAVASRRVINKDDTFDLSSPSSPIAQWQFNLGLPSLWATNDGRLGFSLNAHFMDGLGLTLLGPTAPGHPSFPLTNLGVVLDGLNDYLETGGTPLNNLPEFTLACWIRPADLTPSGGRKGFCGQRGVAAMGFESGDTLTVRTSAGGSIAYAYPYPINQWHHVAAAGDGAELRLYLDGGLVQTGGNSVSGGTYGTSGYTFRIGGGGVFDGSGDFYEGTLDEVLVFEKALSATQISGLVNNLIPN